MAMKGFRYFDHTGDLGVEVWGNDLPSLFSHALHALTYTMTDPRTLRPKISHKISLKAQDLEELFIQWLNEALFLFDTQGLILKECRVDSLSDHQIEATVRGETYDPTRHPIKTAVKGATYHQLRIYQQGGLWKAEVILDL